MRALLPYLPLVLLMGVVGVYLIDQWLRRPTFAIEVLTAASIALVTVFGLVGLLTGSPVTQENVELNLPMQLVAAGGNVLLFGGPLFGLIRQGPEGPGRLIWAAVFTFSTFAGFAQLVNDGPVLQVFVFLPLTTYLLWRSPGTTVANVVRTGKVGLWGLTLTCLAVMPLSTAWLATGGSLIGLDIRFVGVTRHPNQLGPFLVLLLLLNVIEPPARRWALPAWGIPAVLLVLTQSKTAGAGLILGAAALWWYRVGSDLVARFRWLPAVAIVAVTGGLGLVATAVPAEEVLAPERAEELVTLTGRTDIWGAGIEEFLANPIFGAGSDVYQRYAEETGQTWAGQAHNEFVQTIAAEGLVGFTGLMAYLAVLVFLGIRLAPISGGASLALTGAFLLRWITETPAREVSFEQVLVIALLIAWARVAPERARLQSLSRDAAVAPSSRDGTPDAELARTGPTRP
ncbi:O-antigen ligase family protein [Euzebya tangerina]|uniref:O-antigen ligase family protein n=1 Tax=Euzebya tangerina TaxID=591198 RepID=UPI000E31266F|nr:O-antigen ligase family protein [Euzebya tangerina]